MEHYYIYNKIAKHGKFKLEILFKLFAFEVLQNNLPSCVFNIINNNTWFLQTFQSWFFSVTINVYLNNPKFLVLFGNIDLHFFDINYYNNIDSEELYSSLSSNIFLNIKYAFNLT